MATAAKVEPKFQDGDRVRIVERESGPADPKALSYYPFYKNLSGTVIKSYDDNSVAVDIDLVSLPEDIRQRHERSESGMRDKWIAGLGEEEREKLSEKAKRFHLRYTLLVNANDLAAHEGKPLRAGKAPAEAAPEASARKSEAEITAAEEEYLRSKRPNPNG